MTGPLATKHARAKRGPNKAAHAATAREQRLLDALHEIEERVLRWRRLETPAMAATSFTLLMRIEDIAFEATTTGDALREAGDSAESTPLR